MGIWRVIGRRRRRRRRRRRSGFGLKGRGKGGIGGLSTLPMPVLINQARVITKPAPKGLLLRALAIFLPAALWRAVFMLEAI
eukprot:724041-Pelagomonas_calceolata.AAC.1